MRLRTFEYGERTLSKKYLPTFGRVPAIKPSLK
jgi:hypothetical protein